MKHVLELVAATVVVLTIVAGIFYVAFTYFDGWMILVALIIQVAFALLLTYCYRWMKYPGLFQSAKGSTLVFRFVLALFTFTGGLLILALLAKMHLSGLITEKLGERLGLEFKFKRGQKVKISAAAPKHLPWGQEGTIKDVQVVAKDDISPFASEPVGTVIYTLELAGTGTWKIPELELLDVSSL